MGGGGAIVCLILNLREQAHQFIPYSIVQCVEGSRAGEEAFRQGAIAFDDAMSIEHDVMVGDGRAFGNPRAIKLGQALGGGQNLFRAEHDVGFCIAQQDPMLLRDNQGACVADGPSLEHHWRSIACCKNRF